MSIKAARLVGGQGRVAEGHGADARRLRPGRDRHPPPADRRAAARRARTRTRTSSTPATASTSTRRRRCSTSTRSRSELGRIEGAARRDRRRRPALAGRALEHPGARADGRARHARRPAAADPARDRGDGLRGLDTTSTRSPTRTSSTSCACSASGWQEGANYVPSLREYTARWGVTPERLRPGPEGDAPGPDEPRRRDRPARRRLGRRADRDPGARRPRRPDGRALRPAHARARSPVEAAEPRWRWRDAATARTGARTTSSSAARACSTRSRASTQCSTSASTTA